MPREPFVDKRIVGAQEIDDAAILADRAADEQLRFTLEGLQQAEVVVGIPILIDDHFLDAAQIQPLRGEIVDERIARARIAQHPPHLTRERRRIRQLPALRQREQPIIRDTAPDEEREARRNFDVAQSRRCLC